MIHQLLQQDIALFGCPQALWISQTFVADEAGVAGLPASLGQAAQKVCTQSAKVPSLANN